MIFFVGDKRLEELLELIHELFVLRIFYSLSLFLSPLFDRMNVNSSWAIDLLADHPQLSPIHGLITILFDLLGSLALVKIFLIILVGVLLDIFEGFLFLLGFVGREGLKSRLCYVKSFNKMVVFHTLDGRSIFINRKSITSTKLGDKKQTEGRR